VDAASDRPPVVDATGAVRRRRGRPAPRDGAGARDGGWRNVELTGGRIATLDGLRVRWDSVVVRGAHIDYLAPASAELTDVSSSTAASARSICLRRDSRGRLRGCRVDEVDTRECEATMWICAGSKRSHSPMSVRSPVPGSSPDRLASPRSRLLAHRIVA
jgi:hypothetical protein